MNRAVVVQSGGLLAPGTRPGILTTQQGIELQTGSNFEFELIGNTTADRGTNFDGVNVTGGNLVIQSGVNFDLAFNSTGSTVDFTNAFWESNRSWLVFQKNLAGMIRVHS